MESVYELSLLFDFYGGLLTERQRDFFDFYHNDDLSLSEIAETAGVSRQAVHDTITRAEAALHDTENRTGLIARFHSSQAGLDAIIAAAEAITGADDAATAEAARFIIAKARELKA